MKHKLIYGFLAFLAVLALFLPIWAGQGGGPGAHQPVLITFIGAPNFPCTTEQVYLDTSNGDFYSCNPKTGTYVKAGSGVLSSNNTITGSNTFTQQIISTVSTGTAPFVIASTTNVPNLNASSLNGATFAAPGAIGSGTPGSAAHTTISASGQITSTVSTGTAPFSIASQTVVPNLNATLHGGLSAPGSAIVGISDAQTLTNKIIPAIAVVNLTGQQANIGTTTLITPGANGFYRASCYIVLTQVATSSSTLPQCQVFWTDADSSVSESALISASGGSGNTLGLTDIAPPGSQIPPIFYAKTGVAITYSTASYASSGATPMQYAIHVRLEGPF